MNMSTKFGFGPQTFFVRMRVLNFLTLNFNTRTTF